MRKLFFASFIVGCSLFIDVARAAYVRGGGIYNNMNNMNESEMPVLIKALLSARRTTSALNVKTQPRQNAQAVAAQATPASMGQAWQEPVILTKAQYITYLKSGQSGTRADCQDRYEKYNDFFRHDSTLSGQISAREGGTSVGRLDAVCDFLGYAHWCFALGFAYALRDLDDPARTSGGNRCFTYQEFCATRNKAVDGSKLDDYLSRIIDEITFYHTGIKNTSKNTVATTTETRQGSSLITSTSWRVYDTDGWVKEQISTTEMTRLLCR